MYEYEGWGAVISVADEGEDRLIAAINDAYASDFDSVEEIDDAMVFGDYESPDNVIAARYAIEDVDFSDGIFIIDMSPESSMLERENVIGEIMEDLGYDGWLDDPPYARYKVECEQ